MTYLGFDPGGMNNFGVACISPNGNALCKTVSSAQEAVEAFDVTPIGIGVDAPLWWSIEPGGGRTCDQWIRTTYSIPSGSVQSVNSLRGAAIAQGLLISDMISKGFPDCIISESNPKAVIQALNTDFDEFLEENLTSHAYKNEHERDALVCALCCKFGVEGIWKKDLSLIRPRSEKVHQPFAFEARYYWPAAPGSDCGD